MRNLPLAIVCMYQELSVHTIVMSAFSVMYVSELSSRDSITTTNSTNVNNNNI